MSDSSSGDSISAAEWTSLPAATRGLLLAAAFVSGVGLISLISFFAVTGWPTRVAMVFVWLVPEGLVYFTRPDLRRYLPGPLLKGFCVCVGMVPGVIIEEVAEGAGASPAVAKGLFVGVTAAAMTMVYRLSYRR